MGSEGQTITESLENLVEILLQLARIKRQSSEIERNNNSKSIGNRFKKEVFITCTSWVQLYVHVLIAKRKYFLLGSATFVHL